MENADELATLECEDNGKPYGEAIGDVMFSSQMFRYYGSLAMNITG